MSSVPKPAVVCHGADHDDQGAQVGPICGRRYTARGIAGRGLADQARAAGWSVAPGWADHTPTGLVGMCPRCRRPAPEVVALIREVT